jgi:hypothetical protein
VAHTRRKASENGFVVVVAVIGGRLARALAFEVDGECKRLGLGHAKGLKRE